MELREKVVKKLEEAIMLSEAANECKVTLGYGVVEDILALLKAQETSLEEVAADHGLTVDGVSFALNQYQTIICEITHGMMSKLTYNAKDVLQTAQERWCDTCELMKAQEPRVMTLEEVRKLPRGALVWQEHRGVNKPRPRVVHYVTDEYIIYTDGGKWHFELDNYGTKFRLWTTKPSEMKRQAVKWE